MSNNIRLIKIDYNKIYFTNDYYISIEQTNLAKGLARFTSSGIIYWEVSLDEYKAELKQLKIKVTDYYPQNTSSFLTQSKKNEIHFLEFYDLDPYIFWGFLSCYKEKDMPEDIFDVEKMNSIRQRVKSFKNNENSNNGIEVKGEFKFPQKTDTNLNSKRIYNIEFKYSFNDTIFCLGYVIIQKKFDFFPKPIEIKIFNSEILAEYSYIKFYFSKVFNSKKFNVYATIEIELNEIINITAHSKEIESINEDIIDSVKQLRIKKIIQFEPDICVDKTLFTAEEIISKVDDSGIDGNIYKQSEADILKSILSSEKIVRNKKQLEYLSGYKQNAGEKLKITLKPIFGFVFSITGENYNHFCWELLDTHATYLWSFDKTSSSKSQLQEVEESINFIREQGRIKYKSSMLQKSIKTDFNFNVIYHKDSDNPLIDGFVYWKQKFKELLV